MKTRLPHHFEFHKYLKKIIGRGDAERDWYLATEKEFAGGPGIDYPYRSYFYVIGLMHKGNCKIRIGINDYELKERSLSFVGPGIVRSWINNDWKASNHTFLFKPEFFQKPFYNNFLVDYPFFRPNASHVIQLTDADYRRACSLISEIERNVENRKMLQGLFYAYLELVAGVYPYAEKQYNGGSAKATSTANRFSELLHANFKQQKDVAFYAEKLHLSPKNLSGILRIETGKPAKKVIDEFLLLEAKSLLKQTDMSVKEIVFWLGYEDPSYFTKLFKSKVGTTPMEYRGG